MSTCPWLIETSSNLFIRAKTKQHNSSSTPALPIICRPTFSQGCIFTYHILSASISYNNFLFLCRTLFCTVSGAVHCPQPSSLSSLPSVVQLLFLIIKTTLLCFLLSQAAPSNQYTLCIRGCECVCTVAAKWSLHLPPTFSLSFSLSLSLYSGVCLFCPLIIKPHHPHLTPFSFACLSFSPFSYVLFIPSPSTHLSPSFFLSTPPSPLLFTFLWLIIQQLEATSQPYVSENCHLTLLACIISSLLSAFNFARNLWLFLFFLTVKLINRAARSQFPAVWIYLTILAGFKLVFVWKSFLYYRFFSFSV